MLAVVPSAGESFAAYLYRYMYCALWPEFCRNLLPLKTSLCPNKWNQMLHNFQHACNVHGCLFFFSFFTCIVEITCILLLVQFAAKIPAARRVLGWNARRASLPGCIE